MHWLYLREYPNIVECIDFIYSDYPNIVDFIYRDYPNIVECIDFI